MVFLNELNIDDNVMFDHEFIVIPVQSDRNKHRCENRISFYYLLDLVDRSEYILNVNHSDLDTQTDLLNTLKFLRNVYVYGLQIVNRWESNWHDMDLCYWFVNNEAISVKQSEDVELYSRWYKEFENINDIIPLPILLPYYQTVCKQFEECIETLEIDESLIFYKNKVLKSLIQLENYAIPIHETEVFERYKLNVNKLYSNFRIFTKTGRPSNTFNGINLAALNKESGQRKIIQVSKPKNYLVEFDYDSYYVKIIVKLIGYNLPPGNLHEYFGRQYFNTPILTEEQYAESKQITFRMLFGTPLAQYKDIKFFSQVREYRTKIWKQFLKDGFIRMPISNRKLQKENYEEITQNKLFNYILQGTETELNAVMLEKILEYLYIRKSKLILYTYDSFLFEYDSEDPTDFIDSINGILNYDCFKTNIKIGKNYHKMVKYK